MQYFPEIAAVLNIIILFGGLAYLGRKPFSEYLADRSNEVEKNVKESERLQEEALEMVRSYKEKLEKLDEQAKELLEHARKEGEKNRAEILERAERMSAQMIENAKNAALREMELQKAKLKGELMSKVVAEAMEELKNKASEKEHKTFTQTFIDQVGKDGQLN